MDLHLPSRYTVPMLFFKKKPETTDPEEFIHEKWVSRFSRTEDRRFMPEKGSGYTADYDKNHFVLKLNQKNIFAWADNPWYQYRDFNLSADCSFGSTDGYAAMGFCFRKINEANYYYFLISNRGYYRFDLVFNNTPQVLIPWTSFDQPEKGRDIHLRIVARESRFIFLLDEEWIGEADDDSIASGRFAWAGQNYDEKGAAELRLTEVELESRPVEVEAAYYRWRDYVPVEPDLRFRLAESQFLLGAYTPALIQLKRLSRVRPLVYRENLLAAKSFLGSALYEEALGAAEKCRTEKSDEPEVLQVIGTALYSLNRLLPLKELLEKNRQNLEGENWFFGLMGNCEYGLGNWTAAAEEYRKAAAERPEEPLFRENLARAMEKAEASGGIPETEETSAMEPHSIEDSAADPAGEAGGEGELLASWEEAARLYFRQENYDEVRGLLVQIREADPGNRTADALEGKILFHEEKWEEAMELFAPLAEAEETEDSSVYFLYGLLLTLHDLRDTAGRYLEKAAGMEPESFIYQYKAAESRHLRGEDMGEYLERALELEPDDIWINNLAGLDGLERGEPEAGLDFLENGWKLYRENHGIDLSHPGGQDLLINYSQGLFDAGRIEQALAVLKEYDSPEIHNHRGNLLTARGNFPEAVDAYEKALVRDKENRDYRLNCASACLEADFVHRAEELLQLCDQNDPEVLNLLGNLSRIRGEFSRAEAAYTEALKQDGENPAIVLNLAEILHQRERDEEALELLKAHPDVESSRRGRRLAGVVREALDNSIECSLCGLKWELPRALPEQGPLKLRGELPSNAPAGRCSSCGKLFCVACAGEPGEDGRFYCPDCAEKLSINEKKLLYTLRKNLGISEGK